VEKDANPVELQCLYINKEEQQNKATKKLYRPAGQFTPIPSLFCEFNK